MIGSSIMKESKGYVTKIECQGIYPTDTEIRQFHTYKMFHFDKLICDIKKYIYQKSFPFIIFQLCYGWID